MRFRSGDVLSDRYVIAEQVGCGAFGDVYRARSERFGEVAIKILPGDLPDSKAGLVAKEAAILAELEHPNIVKILEIGRHRADAGDYDYLVMEFLAQGTLADYLERQTRLGVWDGCRVGCEILAALACAHNLKPPVIHGDVKPANILLVSDNPLHVKLGDFGLSDRVCAETGVTSAAGTLCYLAPECLWGYAVPGSDVFSAGLVIYQLLTGTAPFALPEFDDSATSKEWRQAVEKSRQQQPPPPSTFNRDIDARLDRAVLRALALDHRERYMAAGDFCEALSDALRDATAGGYDPPVPTNSAPEQSIPVFGREDYRILACSGELTQDDIDALWNLYQDLERPIDIDAGGAFSAMTTTGVTRAELRGLDGLSLSEWLFRPDVTIPELRIIKDLGKLMYSNPYSQRAIRCGMLLYGSAIAQSADLHGERISALTLDQIRRLFSDLLSWPFLPPKYRSLLERARAII